MKQEVSNICVFIHDEKSFSPLGSLYGGQTNFLFLHFKKKTKKEFGLPAYSILYYEVLLSKCEQVFYSW